VSCLRRQFSACDAWADSGEASNVTAMVSHLGDLYVASNGRLWRHNQPSPGANRVGCGSAVSSVLGPGATGRGEQQPRMPSYAFGACAQFWLRLRMGGFGKGADGPRLLTLPGGPAIVDRIQGFRRLHLPRKLPLTESLV
jgi:hypothetical protein